MNILGEIIARKVEEVKESKGIVPADVLESKISIAPAPRSLRRSLETIRPGIVAEFKRRSPSKNWIKQDASVEDIIPAYQQAGAAALSILTDNHYFGGSLADIATARPLTTLPILRKEFIIDRYQLLEARAVGADAVLLIAAAIGKEKCHELAAAAHELGLEVLLEVHGEEELEACSKDVDVIGVNNRDLKTFITDPVRSENIFSSLPEGPLPISESGLLKPAVAAHLKGVGFKGFLIGEAFMAKPNPGEALAEYISEMGLL